MIRKNTKDKAKATETPAEPKTSKFDPVIVKFIVEVNKIQTITWNLPESSTYGDPKTKAIDYQYEWRREFYRGPPENAPTVKKDGSIGVRSMFVAQFDIKTRDYLQENQVIDEDDVIPEEYFAKKEKKKPGSKDSGMQFEWHFKIYLKSVPRGWDVHYRELRRQDGVRKPDEESYRKQECLQDYFSSEGGIKRERPLSKIPTYPSTNVRHASNPAYDDNELQEKAYSHRVRFT